MRDAEASDGAVTGPFGGDPIGDSNIVDQGGTAPVGGRLVEKAARVDLAGAVAGEYRATAQGHASQSLESAANGAGHAQVDLARSALHCDVGRAVGGWPVAVRSIYWAIGAGCVVVHERSTRAISPCSARCKASPVDLESAVDGGCSCDGECSIYDKRTSCIYGYIVQCLCCRNS